MGVSLLGQISHKKTLVYYWTTFQDPAPKKIVQLINFISLFLLSDSVSLSDSLYLLLHNIQTGANFINP